MATINRKLMICPYCLQAIKSRGESVKITDESISYEESIENNRPCDWCGEYDELRGCEL